jgi:hypothetical protein
MRVRTTLGTPHNDDVKVERIEPPQYKMATLAYHKLGNISRRDDELCLVYARIGGVYIGAWVEGFGFFDVLLPPLHDARSDRDGESEVRMSASMPRTVREFAERDARAFDLFHKGVDPVSIAERLGINRVATVHQMIERARVRTEEARRLAAAQSVT